MNEGFLSRWSRRKHDSRRDEGGGEADASGPRSGGDAARNRPQAPGEASRPASPASAPEKARAPRACDAAPPETTPPESTMPELPPIDSLTPESDFRAFMRPGVDGATRNAALAQLFRDPRFNVMDGLDVYIDDYTRSDPIPSSMLAKLQQLHTIGLSDEEIERRGARGELDAAPPSTVEARAAGSAPQAAGDADGDANAIPDAVEAAAAADTGDDPSEETTKPQETKA